MYNANVKSHYNSNFLDLFKINEKSVYFTGVLAILFFIGIEQLLGLRYSDQFLQHIPHHFWRDVFLINYTFMGDGVFVLGLFILLRFQWKKKEVSNLLLFSFLTTGIMIQLLKNYFLSDDFIIFFEPGKINFTDSEQSYSHFFNPSMHAALAFMAASCIALRFRLSVISQLSFLFTSVGIACSRVYLAQHSVMELWTGALTGTLSAVLVYWVGYNVSVKSCLNSFQRNSKKENAEQVLPA
jgi:membrane-associated phospholipid phosphatase